MYDTLRNSAAAALDLVFSIAYRISDSDKFKGVEKPGEYQDKGIFKYTAGEYKNQEDAVRLQSLLRKQGFKDAFVIAMQDGKRVPLK